MARKQGVETAEAVNPRVKRTPIPDPPARNLQFGAFDEYWRSLYPQFANRVLVYGYRSVPPIRKDTSDGTKKFVLKTVDHMTIEDMKRAEEMGSGGYSLYLKDGLTGEFICRTFLVIEDPKFPPKVKAHELDFESAKGKKYAREMRERGKALPNDPEAEEEAVEMAASEAVKELASTVKDLAEGAVREARESGRRREPDANDKATTHGMEMMADAAKRGFEMVTESTRMALENVRREGNPLETLDAAANILAKIKGGGGDNQLTGLIGVFLQNMQQQNAALQQQNTELLREMRSASRSERNGASSLTETAKEFLALRDMLDSGRREEEGGGWTKHIPAIMSGFGALAGAVAVISHNIAVARTGQGTPLDPTELEQMQHQPAEDQPAAVGELPAPEEEEDQQEDMIRVFLSQLEAPLREALESGAPGGDFAAVVIGEYGRSAHQALVQMGGDKITTTMQTHAPLAALIANNPRWPHFLREFLTYTGKPTANPKPQHKRPSA